MRILFAILLLIQFSCSSTIEKTASQGEGTLNCLLQTQGLVVNKLLICEKEIENNYNLDFTKKTSFIQLINLVDQGKVDAQSLRLKMGYRDKLEADISPLYSADLIKCIKSDTVMDTIYMAEINLVLFLEMASTLGDVELKEQVSRFDDVLFQDELFRLNLLKLIRPWQ